MSLRRLCLADQLEHLRAMVSESAAFQMMVGAANSTEAKTKILYGYSTDEAESSESAHQPVDMPRAIVSFENLTDEITPAQTNAVMFLVYLERVTPQADENLSQSARYKNWLDVVSDVLDDVRELAYPQARLNLRSFSFATPPFCRGKRRGKDQREEWAAVLAAEVQT